MKSVTLTILAEDIKLLNYGNSENCPITRALLRAGYSNLRDIGNIKDMITGKIVYFDSKNNHIIRSKLFGMYNTLRPGKYSYFSDKRITPNPIPVEDFTVTIELDI